MITADEIKRLRELVAARNDELQRNGCYTREHVERLRTLADLICDGVPQLLEAAEVVASLKAEVSEMTDLLHRATLQVGSAEAEQAQAANDLRAALSAQAGGDWIACSERMPPHGFYLVYDPRCKRIRLMQWYAENLPHRWYDEEDNQFHGTISHWRELPSAPTESST